MKAKLLTLFALLGLSASPLMLGCGGDSESPEYVEPTEEEELEEGDIDPDEEE